MNSMPDRPAEFLSEISWRYPTFKFHDKLAHAKNAVALKGFGKIYQWNFETDTWDVLYDIPRSMDYPSPRLPWQSA